MSFTKWASIEGFHNVRKAVTKYELHEGSITYRGKVKLHGTNAGIVIKPNGDVFAQSRTSMIAVGNDNAGFAAWVDSTAKNWRRIKETRHITIYGEWFGPGIQKGVAANKVPTKMFAIFSIQYGHYDDIDDALVIIDPSEIVKFFHTNGVNLPENVHILPWYGDDIEIDYADTDELEKVVVTLNDVVDEVEKVDPWIKDVFDIEGTGEGLVYYPVSFQKHGYIKRWHLSTFMFKCKGLKHQTIKQKNVVQLNPEIVASIDEFVDLVTTKARLEQGAREVNRGELVFDKKLIGPFIGWFSKDVKKESNDELEASGLDWKQVNKEITKRAREWYLAKLEEI